MHEQAVHKLRITFCITVKLPLDHCSLSITNALLANYSRVLFFNQKSVEGMIIISVQLRSLYMHASDLNLLALLDLIL
jgi:hypothetical protein